MKTLIGTLMLPAIIGLSFAAPQVIAELTTKVIYSTDLDAEDSAQLKISAHENKAAWSLRDRVYYWDGESVRQIGPRYYFIDGAVSLRDGKIAWVDTPENGSPSSDFYWNGDYDSRGQAIIETVTTVTTGPYGHSSVRSFI